MAGNGRTIKIASQVVVSPGTESKLSELIRYLLLVAPKEWANTAAEAMAPLAQAELVPGAGYRTGTLKESIEWSVKEFDDVPEKFVRTYGMGVAFKDGVHMTQVYTTATRGEQRAAEYAMRYDAANNGPTRRGIHLRGAKARGLPYATEHDAGGYALYVEKGKPRGRRSVPFMSRALAAGRTVVMEEIASEARAKIRATMGR